MYTCIYNFINLIKILNLDKIILFNFLHLIFFIAVGEFGPYISLCISIFVKNSLLLCRRKKNIINNKVNKCMHARDGEKEKGRTLHGSTRSDIYKPPTRKPRRKRESRVPSRKNNVRIGMPMSCMFSI